MELSMTSPPALTVAEPHQSLLAGDFHSFPAKQAFILYGTHPVKVKVSLAVTYLGVIFVIRM